MLVLTVTRILTGPKGTRRRPNARQGTNPLVQEGEVATAVTRTIDHILVRSTLHGPTLQVTHCQRVLNRPMNGVWVSDHYGVLADLVLPTNPPGFRS